ncbi:DNA polymerase alpha, subunit B [Phellopilus nigrolimitatus]|nr:DNA polymerase alpha, subunit B [Phellopilus nigrolimitatus]
MSATVIRDQLISNIPEIQDNEKLLLESISICQNYNISGTDFFYKWEAKKFSSVDAVRGSQIVPFTLAAAEDIKKELVNELSKKRVKEQHAQQKRSEMLAGMMRRNHHSASRGSNVVSGGTSSRSGAKMAAPRVSFKGPTDDKKKRKYRYMYEKISERSEILDERIDEFGELIRDHYNIEELGDPCSTSEEEIVAVGRICNDAEASSSSSSKLAEGSIFLESSRMMGSGARVALRFSPSLKLRGTAQGAGGLGLFHGAIVALRGKNGGGELFVVDEILGLPPLTVSSEPASHKAFTMVVACGPYSVDADLDYKHFGLLMDKMSESRPSVLLLLGPFIDSSHPIVKTGDLEQTPTELFKERLIASLRSFLKISLDSLILLEPSIRDILSDHPVYPQCELENPFLADPRIKMIPNPCRFSINDVIFASTSVDVLLHLRSQEYMQRGQEVDPVPPVSPESSGTDPFTNTCRHLLQQRSFYPLFPVPADFAADVNLDITHSEGLRLDPNAEEYAPDVLILPSKYKQFNKLVDATWAVNPSSLTKGTYATISVPDTPRTELKSRMRCEIAKV